MTDFPQTKLDSEIIFPFLGEPDFFYVCAKNSLIKNIFEEETKFDSGTRFSFLENSSKLVVF